MEINVLAIPFASGVALLKKLNFNDLTRLYRSCKIMKSWIEKIYPQFDEMVTLSMDLHNFEHFLLECDAYLPEIMDSCSEALQILKEAPHIFMDNCIEMCSRLPPVLKDAFIIYVNKRTFCKYGCNYQKRFEQNFKEAIDET